LQFIAPGFPAKGRQARKVVGLPHYVPVRQGCGIVKVQAKNAAGRTLAKIARPIIFMHKRRKIPKSAYEQSVNFSTPFLWICVSTI